MADIPRDPRQLARDILAGRVSLEDLAREQARRRGTAGSAPQPPAPAPPRPPVIKQQPQIPLARPLPPRPAPPRPTQRTYQPPRPQQSRQPARPQAQPLRPIVQAPAPTRSSAIPQAAAAPAGAPTSPVKKIVAPRSTLQSLFGTKSDTRRAVLLSEILAKPISLRD